ncbi:MAG: 23S rRNA pseudouridine2605 synthase [Lentimonas sp.]|jgi:23S rRNA pseudouridine2605 synthase
MLEMNTKDKGGRRESSKPGYAGKTSRTGRPVKPVKAVKPVKDVKDGEAKKKVTPKDKGKYIDFKIRVKKGDPMPSFNENEIRLNKYLSNAGICSRREADVLISTGVVSVNEVIVTELGYKIKPTDVVKYDGESIRAEKKRYVLLNKPKGFVTAWDDPLGRKTVMGLVKKACKERIYPIGRLDRESTGLLLFTNDGDMMKKLTHPQHKGTKIYHIETDKNIKKEHLEGLLKGIDLADGKTFYLKADFVKDGNAKEAGVELKSGKAQVVRRTFEALGYKVLRLDRVSISGLTKRDLPRGEYRHLSEKEVSYLKMT